MNKFLRNLEMLDEEMDTQPNPRQPRTQISSDTKSTRNKRQLWRSSGKKLLAETHLKGVLARDKEGDAWPGCPTTSSAGATSHRAQGHQTGRSHLGAGGGTGAAPTTLGLRGQMCRGGSRPHRAGGDSGEGGRGHRGGVRSPGGRGQRLDG